MKEAYIKVTDNKKTNALIYPGMVGTVLQSTDYVNIAIIVTIDAYKCLCLSYHGYMYKTVHVNMWCPISTLIPLFGIVF